MDFLIYGLIIAGVALFVYGALRLTNKRYNKGAYGAYSGKYDYDPDDSTHPKDKKQL